MGIHNGVIRNSKKLQEMHKKDGIEYVSIQENGTFNDSEALVYDLAQYFEGKVDKITAAGTVAFIVVKRDKQGKPLTLFFGHNSGNPLVMKKTENSLTISSIGEGEAVPVNKLFMFDYETKTLRSKDLFIQLSDWSYNTGGSSNAGFSKPASHTHGHKAPVTGTTYKVPGGDDDLKKLKEHISKDFYMRIGDKKDIANEILTDNQGKYQTAALTAQLEAGEAAVEIAFMNGWNVSDEKEDTITAIIDYVMNVESYKEMMEEIADEFHAKARKNEEATQEGFGFHGTANRTSPSSVLQNNNEHSLDK